MQVELVDGKAGNNCPCVTKHVPLPTVLHKHHIVPLSWGGPNTAENIIKICPNAHYNIHDLHRYYKWHNGRPPGHIRKHYSKFVEDLAQRGWDGRDPARAMAADDMHVEEEF